MTVLLLCAVVLYLVSYRYFWKAISINIDQSPGFEMVSHRGVTIDAPENTLESFMAAIERGFSWIELDVLPTKDRALVCSHNFDLERETDSYGYIHHLLLKDLKNVYTGVNKGYSGGFRIPTLVEVIDSVPDNIGLNIEIKYSSIFDFTGARALCKLSKILENRSLIVSSFNPLLLIYIKVFFRLARIGFLIDSKKFLWVTNWIHPNFLHARGDIIDPEIISLCKEKNIRLIAWTVNNRDAIKWCFNNNVIGVITDREGSTL